jgi:hypothetical protein
MRSIQLFAPADGPTPNPAFLPAQVLVTLAHSSAKIGCPATGRGIIEEWLACRVPTVAAAEDGYEKVLEVYCLSILPALGEWTYAKQFLGYETELPAQNREVCIRVRHPMLRTQDDKSLFAASRHVARDSARATPRVAYS